MSQLAARAASLPDTHQSHHREAALSLLRCKIGANESSEASATPEDSTPSMVQWRVGDSVDYEVNGTWYPGYIARSDSSTLYFKYEATKFKSYEEPIKKADRDDLARLRAGSGSGPPAAAKKKKPARKPAKSPAKKKTVRARRIHSLPLVAREDPLSHRSLNPRPENQRPSKWPSQRLRSLPRSRASPASMMAHRRVDRSPTQASQEAGLEGEESREETDRQEVASQEEVARPQEKEVVA